MPRFVYKAKQGPNKIVDGVIEAEHLNSAVRKIMDMGYTPIDVAAETQDAKAPVQKKTVKSLFSFQRRVPTSALVVFTRQMSDLVEASVPLLRALQIAINQTRNAQLKAIVIQMAETVKDGANFSDALNQHPAVFPGLFVSMVRAGEVSGQLDLVLKRLADLTERDQDTRNRVIASLAYPAFVLFIGVLGIFVLLSFVIPNLTEVFEDLNQTLPLATQILISVSDFFAQFWWIFVAVFLIFVFYLQKFKASEKGKMWLDHFKLKLPLFGNFLKEVEIGRFARILGTLLESGVVIIEALKSVVTVLENEVIKAELTKVSDEVANGVSMSTALKDCQYFPEMAVNMIAVGEETGHPEQGLYKLADAYERTSERTVRTVISLIGPVALVVIVLIIGGLFISMLLPILEMNLIIQ